jgi:TonB family protein
MILLLLKVSVLFALTLALTGALRRSSAALRHLMCVCGLVGALLLGVTLMTPPEAAVLRISLAAVPAAVRAAGIARRAPLPLGWMWLAGTVLLLLRLAIGHLRLAGVLRVAEPTADTGVMFADVSVPVVAGLLKPVILLPRAAAEWPAERLEAALRHERAHLRRHDLWTLLLSHVACAVYWFHPLVWMVAARLRREQEQAADDAVLLSGFEPACYAEALLAAAQNLTSTQLIGCHMITENTFRSRVARLLVNGMPRVTSTATLRRVAIVFACAVVGLGLLNGQDPAYKVVPGNGITMPHVISKADPVIPEGVNIAGTVRLSLVIDTEGNPRQINVVRSLGRGLDEAAVAAVRQWKFTPGSKDGQPVNIRTIVEVNFRQQ